MAGRLYWSMLLPLIPANSATISAAFTANPTLAMYAKGPYYRRFNNLRISMGFGPAPFTEESGGP